MDDHYTQWIVDKPCTVLPASRNQSTDLQYRSNDWFLCDGSNGRK